MRYGLTGARIFTGEAFIDGACLELDGGQIAAVHPAGQQPEDLPCRTLPAGSLLVPGFIDIQVNGGGGVLFNDSPTPQALAVMVAAHRRFGTTGLLPTVITDTPAVTEQAAGAVLTALTQPGSGVLGLHLEGPFINPARRGCHAEHFVRTPSEQDRQGMPDLARWLGPGRLLLTLAPEQVDDGFIRAMVAAGAVVSGGHSAAGAERTRQAVAAGLSCFTHLFNAMPPIAGREPGIAGAAILSPQAWCGIICDGVHVDPLMLRLVLAARGAERLILVTDAMPPTGTDADQFQLYGETIYRRDGRLVTAAGVLAGADTDMAACVRNAVTLLELPLETALRMASLHPAMLLGQDRQRGRIASGFVADLTLLSADLTVLGTWIGGDWAAGAADG